MSLSRPSVTILVHRDGAIDSRSIRIPVWALRAGLLVGLVLVVVLVLGFALYAPLLRTAAQVPMLKNDVARLEADNAKIRELVAALDSAEQRYSQVRHMMGADVVRDPLALTSSLPLAPAIRAHQPTGGIRYEQGASIPAHWPLEDPGYVTRGQVGTGTVDEAHPGVDIAIPTGTMVRAAAGGSVVQAGPDPEYGSFVLLQHPAGYQTVYGHLSRILVSANDTVEAGQVLGLSGNTGRSSAPHLHFEIRRDGKSLDPLTMVKEGS
jgi:murein DD-endopeptidase MepM/ murein hydrolase activator NlpD